MDAYADTNQPRFIDSARRLARFFESIALVNHFFMNQFHTGGFGHLALTQEIVGGKGWQGWEGQFGSENPGCCSLWGQWALGQVGRYIVTQSEDTISINLYPSAAITLPERGVCIKISSDLPRLNKARLRILCQKPQSFTLALRIPSWANDMHVICDAAKVQKQETASPLRLTRTWKNLTTIDIEFVSRLRVVPWPASQPEGVALFDGPLCLGLSDKVADVKLPWAVLVDDSGRPHLDGQGRPQVTDPSGRTTTDLQPISAFWLVPDIHDPIPKRVLFQTRLVK